MLACKAGCAYCCHRAPEATAPEVLAAVQHVQDTFSATKKRALLERIEQYAADVSKFRDGRISESRVACPYLENNLCSIYLARPSSCRGLNSVDAGICENISLGEASVNDRPALAAQIGIAGAARIGLRLAMVFEAIEAATVDLGYASKIAFENPGAAEDFLDGKDRFAEARLPYDLEVFEPGEMALKWEPAFRTDLEKEPPTGNLSMDLVAEHKKFIDISLGSGDFKGALAQFEGGHAVYAMAKIDVPRLAETEAAIHETREEFVAALHGFEAARYPAADAFDALSIHQTMALTYQGLDNLEIMKEHGRLMVEGIAQKCLPELTEPIPKRTKGKLRVGYISANLNNSNGGRWAYGWLSKHGPDIERFCFLLGWRYDNVTARFNQAADHFYWLARSVPENARFIKSLDLDVLIFTDIGLHARSTQYSSLRMAPVQCTAWGHPDTTGLSTIDYYLSGEMMEPPNGQDFYTEVLVLLPRTGLCYPKAVTAPADHDRAYFGLPESEKLIFMAQANMKMLPQHDYLYAEICDRVGAPLVVLESATRSDHVLLKKRLEKAGVRTRWLPYQEGPNYLALMGLADVSLDTPMWSGGNTTVQALSLDTPVVTLPGPYMRGRHSLAMLQTAGVPGLIAKDEKDYIDLACDFERQRELMKAVDPGPLYGDVEVVQALDEFLWKAARDRV
jgi:Fe-S-cluster containining protein